MHARSHRPVDADGGLDITTPSAVNLSIVGTTLNNHAAATWSSSPGYNDLIYLDSGAAINNLAGATFTVTGGGRRLATPSHPSDSSAVAFNNAGTFIASTSAVAGDDVESTSPSPTPAPSSSSRGRSTWAMPRIPAR